VNAHESLRVTLEELRSADKRGKWWIVGAAWKGDPLVEHVESRASDVSPAIQPSDTLLRLARKQGMNTDIRRSIFVILMSSNVGL
jgi:nucleolar MIF4G domain-containing protein 1